jgi:hypothetical protein
MLAQPMRQLHQALWAAPAVGPLEADMTTTGKTTFKKQEGWLHLLPALTN